MSTTTTTESPSTPPQILIPSLPNDIALNILARIPRSYHPRLTLVSKPFRSILSSPLLYTTRSLLNTSQHFLYLSLRIPTTTSLQWFTLYPDQTKNSLIPLTPAPSPLVGSAFAAVGPKIYVIGGSINDIPSPHVWALDCRSHTWEAVPSMRISREFAAAGVVDGRIYVIGGCVVDTWAKSRNWAEVFDPKTERWDSVDSGKDDLLREKWMHGSAVVNERIYVMADRNGVVYEPKTKRWESVESELDLGWRGRACVVNGILYCYDYVGNIRGFDVRNGAWKELRGVEKELPRFLCGATMANVGGKLVVVWERKGNVKEMEVWCAEIEVEENGEGELRGRVEWCDVVHKVPIGSSIVHCLAVSM
ncbi:hypothetical protein POPTR_007G081100v4 [Populus trichocarpa]|uniref:F-box domain-containing protein n=1 Tax=Populus trichocarpa TaxID=3694 RepID=B9HFY5_POPTR|nr:F-box/kelch-repeat protein SKIP6 [Populus trichocarpa]XP_052310370.1 F-box/kelch-repeat protein SKIP6 [Populus trichocarpa]PNT27750.1 hypothetical protein POPTR_007G081100v4 [Populus trichocarpa]|eukprot:XP_002310029.1 F-box/kelch-repeat protein SKIP6 [Populus trichocarpa]